MDENEHEIDAFLGYLLREGQCPSPDREGRLPELSEEEEKALDELGEDLVERILAGQVTESSFEEEELELAGSSGGYLNRAKSADAETEEEVVEKKEAAIKEELERREPNGPESKGDSPGP